MRTGFLLFTFSLLLVSAFAGNPEDPWRATEVLHPAELAVMLTRDASITVVMVGPRVLYNGNHIRGAIYGGFASTPDGMARLKTELSKLSKKDLLVLYCGCCPMDKCPNIRPAFKLARKSGFENVKILEVPTNLPTDWTGKGFPVEKGANSPLAGEQRL